MEKCRNCGEPIELDQYLKRDRLCTLCWMKQMNKVLGKGIKDMNRKAGGCLIPIVLLCVVFSLIIY